MNPFQDVFISYGRADSRRFAKQLNDRLVALGYTVWYDFDDIPLGVDYQKQIDDGIEKADNFLFIISPHAVNSYYCKLEIELALKRGKRIIPILHVEQISRETWQQRNPQGTDEEWEAYTVAGQHDHFTNMHPEIRKINWVYLREGIDNFEANFQGLVALIERHRDYVHQHTLLLQRALEWERNQRRTRYLLIGEERQLAEAWLATRFSHSQPPCEPTDLHCEFIAESIKNANNLMTQVFLAYAEEDDAVAARIRHSLRRQGLTIWSYQNDVETGEDFQTAINRGIEQADNIIYLLSPGAQQSLYCQQELDYACSLNKRIIPVLIEAVAIEKIPQSLQGLQYIDLAKNVEAADYADGESQLLRVLREDAAYHNEHKVLLSRACKWERQHRNPSMLLRGYNLRQAEAWLKVAETHHRYPATALQTEFIHESLRHPPASSLDVFISYSRTDSEIARRLNEALQIRGKTTWFDQESIASGTDFQQAIYRGLEVSDHFLFILSPRSISSPYCADEVEYAVSLNKRIVTVLYRPIDITELHPHLAKVQWIDFSAQTADDFATNLKELVRVLETDAEHLHMHTRLLTKAIEWKKESYDRNFLLRGKELIAAQQWLEKATNKQPTPSKLQVDFILTSLGPMHYLRSSQGPRIKFRSVAFTSVAVTVAVVIARFAGLLQGIELFAYDHLMRQRPSEAQDNRFLIVTVDQQSESFLINSLIEGRYKPSIGSIPDEALNEALKVLTENDARLIGLDFYRDFPADEALAETLISSNNLISTCLQSSNRDGIGIWPMTEAPIEQVGFANLIGDRQGGADYLRRHYLVDGADPEFCDTNTSFSLLLAKKYLEKEGIEFVSPAKPEGGFRGNGLKFGEVSIPNIAIGRGPYYNFRGLQGYQTLLNFRTANNPDQVNSKDPNFFAPKVSFQQLIEGQVPADLIQNRIVIIGFVDFGSGDADFWSTPYGFMSGTILQGQMTSQLISAVLDGRPLIWWWPFGLEVIWVAGFSLLGGLIVWGLRRLNLVLIVLAGSIILLYLTCYITFVVANGWIPLVPPAVGMLMTSLAVAYLTFRLRLQKLFEASHRLTGNSDQ